MVSLKRDREETVKKRLREELVSLRGGVGLTLGKLDSKPLPVLKEALLRRLGKSSATPHEFYDALVSTLYELPETPKRDALVNAYAIGMERPGKLTGYAGRRDTFGEEHGGRDETTIKLWEKDALDDLIARLAYDTPLTLPVDVHNVHVETWLEGRGVSQIAVSISVTVREREFRYLTFGVSQVDTLSARRRSGCKVTGDVVSGMTRKVTVELPRVLKAGESADFSFWLEPRNREKEFGTTVFFAPVPVDVKQTAYFDELPGGSVGPAAIITKDKDRAAFTAIPLPIAADGSVTYTHRVRSHDEMFMLNWSWADDATMRPV